MCVSNVFFSSLIFCVFFCGLLKYLIEIDLKSNEEWSEKLKTTHKKKTNQLNEYGGGGKNKVDTERRMRQMWCIVECTREEWP